MSPAKRELHPPQSLKHATAPIGLGLLLGFLGPFGSQSAFDRPVRYAFWLGLTLFGYGCVLACRALFRRQAWSAPVEIAIVAAASSVPQTFAVAWAFSVVQPGRTSTPAELPALFGAVLVVQLVVTLAAFGVDRSAAAPRPLEAAPQPAPFLDRLPPHLGRDLVALEAQDHYLRVHTSAGSDLVLMRLSDAIAQLGGTDGLQVHRGWWVAAEAVAGVSARAGNTSLSLRNGLNVPVSRTYLQAVRERAWPQLRR